MGTSIPPQGYFWWPGVDSFLHGSFTFTHGISPSLATLYIIPQLTWPDMTGNLQVNYLPGGEAYQFTDCILDFISVERGADGRQVWGLHILDRRWKWKDCGRISGNYNIRWQNGDGDSEVFTPSLKPLKELMKLCLDAMGEGKYGYDLSGVTEQTYPQVEWDYENPAHALLELADKYGYRVILTLENQVLLAKANQGSYLPDGTYLSGATTLNPPNTPSSIIVVAGHTLAQYDFPLVPMAMELDNTIVPLNKVSYKPNKPHGWGDASPPEFSIIEDPVAQAYARKSVWKYFQISVPFTMEGIDPSNSENDSIDDFMRVLPLLDTQLVKAGKQLQPASDDEESDLPAPGQPLPAIVYGIYWTSGSSANSCEEIDSSLPMKSQDQGRYTGSFQIDGERGLVIFDDYTFSYTEVDSGVSGDKVMFPPTLYLRTSCNVRDAKTLGFLRLETEQDMGAAGLPTEPMYVKSDDVAFKVTYKFQGRGNVTGSTNNLEEVKTEAKYTLLSTLAKMQIEDPQSFEYPGFQFIDLDGAIQQITWSVGEDGKATTQANRCKEDLVNTQSYDEAKQQALLNKALANKEKVGRILKQDTSQALTVTKRGPLVSK